MKSLVAIASIGAVCVGCDSSTHAETSSPGPEARATTAQPQTARSTNALTPASAAGPTIPVAGVAACQPTGEVSAMVSRWIELADADGDGQISRNEAQSFTNFVIGGFFFQADRDGDGVLTAEEGRAARSDFASQHPALATLLSQARQVAGESPFKALAGMVDVDYGKPLSADDARKAARDALSDLFEVADQNEDGTITPAEARAASWQGVRSLGHRAFQSVDQNGDGKLELAEFQRAVDNTAKLAFQAGDANDNGSLTEQEAAVALSDVVRRLGIPTPEGQGDHSSNRNQK